ncbi:MAG: MBL fold metallo-hydrolase [Ruminococcaceae bacterium]|nr:MBL fold metallo-hydrolase [Oscillospiraceae bacterium]
MVHTRLILGELETNCYLVWSEHEGIVIDPADEAEEILSEVAERGISITAVVLTHAHFDHMLAAEAVCAHTGAPLYIGAGDVDALTDPKRNLSGWFSPGQEITIDKANLLYEGGVISFGNASLTVLETPGHTPGCICLHTENTLFSGDTLFRNSIGRLDFPGGDVTAMKRSLERLLQLPDSTAVYPGHGPDTTIGTEKKYNPYLR